MNRRLLSAAVLVVSSLLSAEAAYAAPTTLPLSLHAMFGKTRMVAFTLRNDSSAPLKVKAGDSVMTIDPGKTLNVKLPAGTSVTAEDATTSHAAGSLIAQVTSDLAGATIAIR
jgi:hypothetical protein